MNNGDGNDSYDNSILSGDVIIREHDVMTPQDVTSSAVRSLDLDHQTFSSLAVSSSPRPWIDVFALPEKFNMAVTESDLDPKVRKISITF